MGFSEKVFVEDVENFFNEEDHSVGMYAVNKIDKEVVEEFEGSFDGVRVLSYDENELEIQVSGSVYKVVYSTSYERWQVVRQIKF